VSGYKDGATMRKQRKYDLADFISAYSEGLEWSKAIDEGVEVTGNQPNTVIKYLTELINYGVMFRDGSKVCINAHGFRRWAEIAGFRAPPMQVRCLECGLVYTSYRDTCPRCNSVSRELYEPETSMEDELPSDTHTPTHQTEIKGIQQLPVTRIELQPPLGEVDASEVRHTHIHTQSNDQAGAEAELRVTELLARFGSAKLGRGSHGEPDVLFYTDAGRYAVEVKSVQHQTRTTQKDVNGYKVGEISLNRESWAALCEYAENHDLTPLLVTEIKIQGAKQGHLYHIISREAVDYKANTSNSKYIRLSVHELPAYSLQSFRPGLPFLGRCVL